MTFNDTNDESFSVYIGCTHAGIPAFISSEIILCRVSASRTRQLIYYIGVENITITTSGSTNY